MSKRADSVQILAVTSNKKILLLQERTPHIKKSFYSVVGGLQEKNENILTTAKRELLEETGYTSNDWKLLKKSSPGDKTEWTIYTYIAKNCQKKHEPHLDAGEKIKVMLVDFKKFMEIATGNNFRSIDLTFFLLKLNYQKKLREFKKNLFNK
jgi:8-oxo-dGTP pyrophosphatase MutT (NUDIX family)